MLERFYNNTNVFEYSLDEVGRGCLFGRVYIACVVLPKDVTLFDGKNIKDSKKFSSKKKMMEVAEYIKNNALAWHVSYIDEKIIDEINILQATMRGMHECLDCIISKLNAYQDLDKSMALIDGNYFIPYRRFDLSKNCIVELPHITIEKGDNKFMGIAAASILAKSARDSYINDLCKQYPILIEKYGLDTNMGYGTKKHLDGIREHGITEWHRRSFGNLCRESNVNCIKIKEP